MLPALLLLLIGCTGGDSSEQKKDQQVKEPPEETKGAPEAAAKEDIQENEITRDEDPEKYTAGNVYHWLKDSNLLEGEPESLSAHIQNHPAFVNGISTNDIDIIEFETADDAAQFKDEPIALVHENIVLIFLGSMKQLDSFQSVLDAREPVEGLYKAYYNSPEQQDFVHKFRNGEIGGFKGTVDSFYNLEPSLKSDTFVRFMYNKEVIWEGVLVQTFPDFLVVYSGESYNGENWLNIETNTTEMLPYTFVVETQNLEEHSLDLNTNRGDPIKVKGKINKQGSLEKKSHWRLTEGFVIQ
jgi:hypothetical protein